MRKDPQETLLSVIGFLLSAVIILVTALVSNWGYAAWMASGILLASLTYSRKK